MTSNLIYCDESGFTGDDLMNPHSPHFVYSSINIDGNEAESLVRSAVKHFKLQGNELKGKHLVKHKRGRLAIEWLLQECVGKVHLVAYEKRYALACLFHQWTFDEIFAESNSLFYMIGFNRFISNAMFLGLHLELPLAARAIRDFQALMRTRGRDLTIVQGIFSLDGEGISLSSILECVVLFCRLHKSKFLTELNPLFSNTTLSKWRLDLSFSALYSALCYWGNRKDAIVVLCDESEPIRAQVDNFESRIGANDQLRFKIGDIDSNMTFNLESIALAKSHDYAGIQLADVFASAFSYALNHKTERYWSDLIEHHSNLFSPLSVMPDLDYIDLNNERAFVNGALLAALVDASCRGNDPEEALASYFAILDRMYPRLKDSINSYDIPDGPASRIYGNLDKIVLP